MISSNIHEAGTEDRGGRETDVTDKFYSLSLRRCVEFLGINHVLYLLVLISQINASFEDRLQVCHVKCPSFSTLDKEMSLFGFLIHWHDLPEFANRFSIFLFYRDGHNASA